MFPDHESLSHWQQNDYKVLNPSVTENPDFSGVNAIQNMPVTSVVCQPEKNSAVKIDQDGKLEVKGENWDHLTRYEHCELSCVMCHVILFLKKWAKLGLFFIFVLFSH